MDDEFLGIDTASGQFFSLNEVAMRVWTLLEIERSVQEICTELRVRYVVDEVTCLEDVSELLTAMADAGLLTCR